MSQWQWLCGNGNPQSHEWMDDERFPMGADWNGARLVAEAPDGS